MPTETTAIPEIADRKRLSMTVLMTPDLANFTGKVHGGHLLNLLDQVAYACACRYSSSYVVTLSVDEAFFREPVHVGELVTFLSSINYVGRTTMEVGIKVVTENPTTGVCRHTMSCFFTMVAVDAQGKPTPAPPLLAETSEDKRRCRAAENRRELRKQLFAKK